MKTNEKPLTRAQAKSAALTRSKSPPPVARKVIKFGGVRCDRIQCLIFSERSFINLHFNPYSTINKITQFWLVESSTINPKLYSVGVPIKLPWKRRVRKKKADSRFAILMALFLPNNKYFYQILVILRVLKLHWPKRSWNFENCQNHSYLLITNCTRGRAISFTNYTYPQN